METERIALSQRERDRLKVLHEVQQKHLTQVAAAERLKVSDRHVRRLLRLREENFGAMSGKGRTGAIVRPISYDPTHHFAPNNRLIRSQFTSGLDHF
jgi:hypothetical protein